MLLALLLTLSMAASGLTGVVKDTTGGAVPGASVTVQTPAGTEHRARSPRDRCARMAREQPKLSVRPTRSV